MKLNKDLNENTELQATRKHLEDKKVLLILETQIFSILRKSLNLNVLEFLQKKQREQLIVGLKGENN